ncbi:MAG: glycosyltransferase family 9 protein [Caulobacteraceae bacterium]|nr:glycosyltransferase family 9 protein [Caulobacteraceae bacterium]
MKEIRKVLVIQLGGIGELVLAFPAFARIREAHPKAKITLLTVQEFASLAKSSAYFNEVETDGRPAGPAAWLGLIARLRRAKYDRVYDLQNDAGATLIFEALRPFPPEWSGTAPGCALPHRNPERRKMHPLERHAEQLMEAGIWPDAPTRPLAAPPPDISWILSSAKTKAPAAGSQRPVVILAPGGTRPEKRWPPELYGGLAERLQQAGFDIVVIGALNESPLAHAIQRKASRTRDLTGRTDFAQVATLGARAALAVGNDSGAMHLIAAAGAPTLALFSAASDPAISGPRGHVTVLQSQDLKNLSVETVARAALGLAQQPS